MFAGIRGIPEYVVLYEACGWLVAPTKHPTQELAHKMRAAVHMSLNQYFKIVGTSGFSPAGEKTMQACRRLYAAG